jgi:hypothetical protein
MYPTLEELANSGKPVDIVEFGLKTEGLVELIRDRPELIRITEIPEDAKYEDEGIRDLLDQKRWDFDYEVPPAFVVPKSSDDLNKLKESYSELVKDEKDYCVILARSSHEDEQPGKFETLTALYDPKNPEDSFNKFLEVFQKVRDDPLKPVIVQKMVGEVTYLDTERVPFLEISLFDDNLDYEVLAKKISENVTEDFFGSSLNYELLIDNRSICECFCSRERDDDQTEELKKFINFRRGELLNPLNGSVEEGLLEKYGKESITLKFLKDQPINPVIGANNTSFTARSHSHIDPNEGVINACIGLTTKLVNNPDEICIFRDNAFPISTGNSYTSQSQRYVQNNMDVFDIETEEISETDCNTSTDSRNVEFFDNLPIPAGMKKTKRHLRNVTEHFSEKFDVPVELEGCVKRGVIEDENKVYIYQLTKSHLLEEVIKELTEVPEERKFYESEYGTVGAVKFSGDLVLYSGYEEESKEQFKKILTKYKDSNKEIMFVASDFEDELMDEFNLKNYVNIDSQYGVCRKLGYDTGGGYTSVHVYGYLISELHRRKLKGDNACCIVDDEFSFYDLKNKEIDDKFSDRRTVDEDNQIITLENVTFEVAKGDAQIYFNN